MSVLAAFLLSLWINRAGQGGEAPHWSKAILPPFAMFCASAEAVVCVLPQTSFFWWSQSRMGVSHFRTSLARSWNLIGNVDFNNISPMKQVGRSVWGHYLNGHMVQLCHVVTVTLLCLLSPEKGICTLLFPWGQICACQQCPGTSLAKQEGTSCVIWGCLTVAGCR